MNSRAGSKIVNGILVPNNIKIYTSLKNREFYISGISDVYLIRFIDNGEYLKLLLANLKKNSNFE